jgi:hypothetical protein
LVKLIIGILTAAEAGLLADIEIEDGKLDFWYQWRKSEGSATAWRNLRKEGYKHYSA